MIYINYRTSERINIDNPDERRRYESCLYGRLKRFGWSLSKGEIEHPVKKKQLKREPKQRGYHLTNLSNGEVKGKRRPTLRQVEEFWMDLHLQEMKAKRQEKKEQRKEAWDSSSFWW